MLNNRTLLLSLFAGLILVRLFTSIPLQSANDRSRWATVWSLVHRGTYQIDEIDQYSAWTTIDKVRHEEHFYSTKPPLLPTIMAGLYWPLKNWCGLSLSQNPEIVSRILLLLVNIIPFCLGVFLLMRIVDSSGTESAQYWTLGIILFATLLTPFLMVFNNHTIAATFLMFSLYGMERILSKESDSQKLYLLVGFAAAMTACNELPAAAFGLASFILLYRHSPHKTLRYYLPAAAIPLIAFFVTNDIATGGWKPFYLYYGTEKYEYIYQGVPSYWVNPQGLDRGGERFDVYLMHCLIGHHGLFSLTPLWLLVLVGWGMNHKTKRVSLRTLNWLGMGLTLLILVFYLTRTKNYNYGGVSIALRWMLWLIPFWILSIIPVIEYLLTKRWKLGVLVFLFLPSLFSAWYPFTSPWQHPWLFNAMSSAGWINYSNPLPTFQGPVTSWIGLLPESPDRDPNYWVEYSDAKGTRLRLEDIGPGTSMYSRNVRVIHYKESGAIDFNQTFLIDLVAFKEGKPPQDFLLNIGQISSAESIDYWFRGVPGERNYQAGRIRYRHTNLREDAFRVQMAATRVATTNQIGEQISVRTDVWYCQEIPFGTLRKITTITDPSTGEPLSQDTLRVSAVGQFISNQ